MPRKTVTGTVKDATGEPMIGVSIKVDGTSTGGVTDFNGKYTINNVPNNGVLKVTYIGYKEQRVSVAGKNVIDIELQEDNTTLEDVVVIGYGTMKRKDLTGSVASVTGDKLAANPVATVAEALQGQLPGVNVLSQDGRPGATMSIRVRGGGSITRATSRSMWSMAYRYRRLTIFLPTTLRASTC